MGGPLQPCLWQSQGLGNAKGPSRPLGPNPETCPQEILTFPGTLGLEAPQTLGDGGVPASASSYPSPPPKVTFVAAQTCCQHMSLGISSDLSPPGCPLLSRGTWSTGSPSAPGTLTGSGWGPLHLLLAQVLAEIQMCILLIKCIS